jgi:hypothetical protein
MMRSLSLALIAVLLSVIPADAEPTFFAGKTATTAVALRT